MQTHQDVVIVIDFCHDNLHNNISKQKFHSRDKG